jgi:hypothetical protein
MAPHQNFPWRVGRKVGRTVYAVTGPTASDTDVLIGVMDTRTLAAEAVACHNARLGWTDPEDKEEVAGGR